MSRIRFAAALLTVSTALSLVSMHAASATGSAYYQRTRPDVMMSPAMMHAIDVIVAERHKMHRH